MRMIDVFSISALNVFRRKSKNIITILSVIIGMLSVLLISSIGTSGENFIISEIEKSGLQGIMLSKNNEVKGGRLEESDQLLLKKRFDSITNIVPVVLATGECILNKHSFEAVFLGVGAHADNVYNVNVLHGRIPVDSDVKGRGNVSVVDDEFALKVYKRTNIVGKPLTLVINGKERKTKIIGVISSQKATVNQMFGGEIPDFIYLPYTTLNELKSDTVIDQFAISCNDGYTSDGSEFAQYLSSVKGTPDAYFSTDISSEINNVKKITKIISLVISLISSIALIVSGLGITNAVLSSVIERKREVGICIAIGATEADVLWCFITETIIISFLGGFFGTTIGNIIIAAVFDAVNISYEFKLLNYISAISVAVLIGIISSTIPAIKATRLEPINALKN